MSAAASFLGQLMAGIQHPPHVPDDQPTVTADEIEFTDEGGDEVSAVLTVPSGDRFRVTVEWLRDLSP